MEAKAGMFTDREINSQPEVWQATLVEVKQSWETLSQQVSLFRGKPLVVTGCGSTYYLSLAAAAVLRQEGYQAWAFPASELVYFPLKTLPDGFNLLAISRSGTTSETLWAVERYRRQFPQGKLAVISCVPETPLARQADLCLLAPDAQEQSVAQTRSFTSMALLVQAFAGLLNGNAKPLERFDRLPGTLRALMSTSGTIAGTLGADLRFDRFFFLGNGPLHGIANEAMLKTKEISCSWAEAYHTLEFRHGPMSVVSGSALVTALVSDSAAQAELRVLRQMKSLGATTLALLEDAAGLDVEGVDHLIQLKSGLNEWERGMLYLPLIQRLAFAHALAKGLDPDRPVNLSAVIELDDQG